MYPYINPNATRSPGLHAEDVARVRKLYPFPLCEVYGADDATVQRLFRFLSSRRRAEPLLHSATPRRTAATAAPPHGNARPMFGGGFAFPPVPRRNSSLLRGTQASRTMLMQHTSNGGVVRDAATVLLREDAPHLGRADEGEPRGSSVDWNGGRLRTEARALREEDRVLSGEVGRRTRGETVSLRPEKTFFSFLFGAGEKK
ncbi:PREDICTED: uncharacterized protein LOC106804884 [Priapulus caudatus]|uniref:Uncharacterized protein LOC106804884 n=1 Tax=Priapulus caudatus TaxID=37621 RepID=A0ABM1DP84_PRICU|nr:PREDICTED: uncharacterized protein LOC106804884 [Priapulus caudatus]